MYKSLYVMLIIGGMSASSVFANDTINPMGPDAMVQYGDAEGVDNSMMTQDQQDMIAHSDNADQLPADITTTEDMVASVDVPHEEDAMSVDPALGTQDVAPVDVPHEEDAMPVDPALNTQDAAPVDVPHEEDAMPVDPALGTQDAAPVDVPHEEDAMSVDPALNTQDAAPVDVPHEEDATPVDPALDRLEAAPMGVFNDVMTEMESEMVAPLAHDGGSIDSGAHEEAIPSD